MNGVVYRIVNQVRGSLYIGSTGNVKGRWKHHRWALRGGTHSNSHLQRAWTKYGEAEFEFEILDVDVPIESLHVVEDDRIRQAVEDGFVVYNQRPTAASNIGFKQSDEVKAKIGRSNKGKRRTTEQRARISLAQVGRVGPNKGRKFGAAFCAKLSAAKRGQKPYVRTEASLAKQRDGTQQAWGQRRAGGWKPVEPKPCSNCEVPSSKTRRGRCPACSEFFRRRGVERKPVRR